MPIINYPGYVSKEHYAKQRRVQVRAINNWITKRAKASGDFTFIKVDGYVVVKDVFNHDAPPAGISLNDLEWVRNFAKRNKIFFERMYEEIIKGTINGIVLGDRIFVNKAEPQVIEYVTNYKRKRKVGVPFYLKYPKKQ